MSEEYEAPIDYRGQLLTVGARVTYISSADSTFTTGTIAYIADDQMCVDSGGLLTVHRAWTHRRDGKPTFVRYESLSRIPDAPTEETDTDD